MRNLSLTVAFLLLGVGCGAATNAPAPRAPEALLEEPAQERVLEAARTQTCRASQTRNPELAAQTQAMLDAYVALHDEHGVEPSWRLERKIELAHRDAEATRRGVATPYHLGCEPFRVPHENALARDRQRRRIESSLRQSRQPNMGAGGVIGNPRP